MDDAGPGIRSIHLVPLGGFPLTLAADLTARVSRLVSAPCHLAPAASADGIPPVEGRRQLAADALLAWLEARPAAVGAILVGLTTEDIGSSLFTFFFGRARLHGRAAIVSLARLVPEFYGLPPDLLKTARRAEREILHEVGHAGGLVHCRDARCLMHFSSNVEAIDLRGSSFCPECAALLPDALRPGRHAPRPARSR